MTAGGGWGDCWAEDGVTTDGGQSEDGVTAGGGWSEDGVTVGGGWGWGDYRRRTG